MTPIGKSVSVSFRVRVVRACVRAKLCERVSEVLLNAGGPNGNKPDSGRGFWLLFFLLLFTWVLSFFPKPPLLFMCFLFFCFFVGYLHGFLMVFGFLMVIVVIYMGFKFFSIEIVVIYVVFLFSLCFRCVFAWVLSVLHEIRCYLCVFLFFVFFIVYLPGF